MRVSNLKKKQPNFKLNLINFFMITQFKLVKNKWLIWLNLFYNKYNISFKAYIFIAFPIYSKL